MPRVFLLLSVLLPVISQAQRSVVFLKTRHDWGDMISTQFPPAAFRFVNKGSQPLAILTTRSRFEVKVTYDRTFVAPGDTGIVYVHYESNQTGMFSEDVQVQFNTEPRPIPITVTGNNVSVISCHPDPKNFRNREVRVIDAVTKEPVPDASCKFFCYNQENPITFTCDKSGTRRVDLPIGMYDISIQAPGYYPYTTSTMIPKTAPFIFYELERNPYYQPPAAAREHVAAAPKKPKPVARDSVARPVELVKVHQQPSLAPRDSVAIAPPPAMTTEGGEPLPASRYRSNNIVFLIDVSNSMRINRKMEKLRKCMKELANVLRDMDSVSIITYNYTSYTKLEAVAGSNHSLVCATIDSLVPFGLTDGVKGIETAYAMALRHFVQDGNNQVIFATDGEFTSGQVSGDDMRRIVSGNARKGIVLSTVSFGDMADATDRLKEITRLGNGSFLQVSRDEDKPTMLVDEIKTRCSR